MGAYFQEPAKMPRPKASGTIANAYGPLDPEVYAMLCAKHIPHTERYRRIRTIVGVVEADFKLWSWIVGHHMAAYERAPILHDMQVQGMVHCGVGMQNITVLDVHEVPTTVAQVITASSQVDQDALNGFLENWMTMHSRYTGARWIRNGLEVKLAARILTQAGGMLAATRLARIYFTLPPSMRPDEISLRNFYNTMPRLLGMMTENEAFAQQQVVNEKRRAASQDFVDDDDEHERIMAEARKVRRLKEEREKREREREGR